MLEREREGLLRIEGDELGDLTVIQRMVRGFSGYSAD